MARFAIVLACVATFSPPALLRADEGGTQRAVVGDHSWTVPESWNTREIPDRLDAVFVPGWVGEATSRVLPAAKAVGGALVIGGQAGAVGSVELVQAELRLTETTIEGVPDAGRMIIGRAGGLGRFVQSGGLVSAGRSIRIADGADSSGRYILNGGIVQAGSGIVVALGAESTGLFEINGSTCAIQVRSYQHGTGNATLKMTADAFGFAKIVAEDSVAVSGTIHVDMSRYSTSSDELLLIENKGDAPIQGGFSKVTLIGAPMYEVDYEGGDGNDITLRHAASQLNSFEAWSAHHLPGLAPGRTGLYLDEDADGVGNLAEYKLKGVPTHVESWELVPVRSKGRWRVRYTDNTDRNDAVLVPQVKVNGRWRSDRLRVEVVEEFSGTRLMEASFRGAERPFRIHAELLPDPGKPMNVMLFIVDDLNDWVGCLDGHPQASTPHIDALAERGTLFTDAHCNAVNCNASRSSMLTGILPSTSGIYHNRDNLRASAALLNAVTLPELFKAGGYDTAKAGKVFHRGEEVWDASAPERKDVGEVHNPHTPKTTRVETLLDWAGINTPDEDFFDHKVATWVIDRLKKRPADKPYFVTTGFYRPHLPWYAPRRFFDRIPLTDVIMPETLETDLADLPQPVFKQVLNTRDRDAIEAAGAAASAVRGYLAATSFSDEQVGRVMAAMDALPDLRNTIIVLVSDHGFHLGEKTHWRKQSLWQESTHVPMIIVAPGVTLPGSQVTQPASLIDLYPTLAELTELEPPAQLEGVSMVPILKDPKAAKNRRVLTSRYYRQHTIRDNQYRYIRYRHGSDELYDHSVDPNEWNNLAIDPGYDKIRQRFRKKLPRLNVKAP